MKLTNLVVNQTAQNIMQQFGTDIEKAHQVGDEHPNGKWVWTEYAPGKFDWRGIKKNASGTQGAAGGHKGSDKEEPKSKKDEPKGKQPRDERFSEDGIVGKDGGFNKKGKTYKRWAALREKVKSGKATPEEKKEFAHIHNQYLNEKSRSEYERNKATDPNAKEPKYETVEERTARFKNSKIVDGISKLSEEAQRSYKDIEAQVNGTAKRKSSNLWIRQELSDYIKANFQKVESNETGGTWQKVYGSNTDSKYGSYMVDIKNKRWRNTTKNEFYGGASVD